MSNSAVLFSTHLLKREELFEILEELRRKGADIDPDEVFDARISRDEKYIWVFLYNSGIEEMSEKIRLQIEEILGGILQSYIEIEISRQPRSEELAIEFSALVAEQWPCAVSDSNERIFSGQDLFDLRKTGKGFPP